MYSGGELGIRMYSEGELSIRTYMSGSSSVRPSSSRHPPHLNTWSSFTSFYIDSAWASGS